MKAIKTLMKALQETKENELTKTIIIPLLETLGYFKVEFFGGQNEEGKDIVCWDYDKLQDIQLTVGQVKHFKFSNKASDSNSLQTVINQLIMCFKKPVQFINKNSYYPQEAYLISTFPIHTKNLQSRFDHNQDLVDRKIKIIDGIRLSNLLFENCPEVVKGLVGEELHLNSFLKDTLDNSIVLRALGFHKQIPLKNIYTDIDFSLGRPTTKLFFNSKIRGVRANLNLLSTEWKNFSEVVIKAEKQFGKQLIVEPLSSIQEEFEKENKTYGKWQKKVDELESKISELKYSSSKISSKIDELLMEESDPDISRLNVQQTEIRKELISLNQEATKLYNKEKKPVFRFQFIGTVLAECIAKRRDEIFKELELINGKKGKLSDLKEFVRSCKETIDISSQLLESPALQNVLLFEEDNVIRSNFESTRFKMPIDRIIDTGINITLLGEAGAGKTTSLQMYAYSRKEEKDKLIIWAPLSHITICKNWNADVADSVEGLRVLIASISEYLNDKGISVPAAEISNLFQNRKCILLLDGLDEAIKSNPLLPKIIVRLAESFLKLQIVVTCRMSGDYINELPFFTVMLLPFTNDQRNSFIDKWFDSQNPLAVKKIKKHLKENKDIDEITRNPLLTTTLCVLANHNLPLPQTELKLYNDRLKLLTGYYDNVKNISTRITVSPSVLETLCQKLAYFLHCGNRREAPYEELEKEAIGSLKSFTDPGSAKTALKELIDPCNLLVPMTDDGKYGFGHLRYQEHLTAKELLTNRNIKIVNLIDSGTWWHGVLFLFGQINDKLDWLIEELKGELSIGIQPEILDNIIKSRPKEEREFLYQMIRGYQIRSQEVRVDWDIVSEVIPDSQGEEVEDDENEEY